MLSPSDADKKRRPSVSLRIRMANDKKIIPAGAEVKISLTMKKHIALADLHGSGTWTAAVERVPA